MSNRTTLKSYFQTGDKPTQSEFADLIDSQTNIDEDKASQAEAEAGTSDTVYLTALQGFNGWLSWIANKTVSALNTTSKNIVGGINELYDFIFSTGTTVSFSSVANFNLNTSTVQQMTLTGNLSSLAVSNKRNGASYFIYLIQDSTGGRTIPTPDSSFGSKTDNSSDFSTDPDAVNIINLNVRPDGSAWYIIEVIT